MKLIVGLGNPWREYRETRHNVGFLFLDRLTEDIGIDEWKKGYQGLYAVGNLDGKKCLFLKPETFMNLSGKSVQACATFYKIHPRDILIIFDDIDMEFGKVRFRESGSAGGHNGMASIIAALWTPDIKRIKIGIGRHEHMEAADWVLSKFTKEEKESLGEIFDRVTEKLQEKIAQD